MQESFESGSVELAEATISWATAPSRAERRALGRAMLRDSIGDRLEFSQVCSRCGGDHGPLSAELDGRPGPLVSVAYSGRLVVVGFAHEGALEFGIDAERDTAARRRAVREAIGAEDLPAWTRLEAVAKARGRGLHADRTPISFEMRGIAGPKNAADWTAEDGHGPRLVGYDIELSDARASNEGGVDDTVAPVFLSLAFAR